VTGEVSAAGRSWGGVLSPLVAARSGLVGPAGARGEGAEGRRYDYQRRPRKVAA